MRLASLLLAIAGALAPTLVAADPAPVRTEVPIREVALSDGARRYAIPIKVGGVDILAGLDTGSTGLRVLSRALGASDVGAPGSSDTYAYGSGAELRGQVTPATVAIGDLHGQIRLQLVTKVDCLATIPACPASRVSPEQYGIEGDGLPGEGFVAIIGVNGSHPEIDQPLPALGAHRWIVELPRPGEAAPGRLILNPTDDELQGYVMVPLAGGPPGSGLHDGMSACLINDASQAKVCGVVTFDSGAPGIQVYQGGPAGAPWAPGSAASLVVYDGSGKPRAVEHLTIGLRTHASRLTVINQPRAGGDAILAGIGPYFAFSVLYDLDHDRIGLKPRPPAPDGPSAEVQ